MALPLALSLPAGSGGTDRADGNLLTRMPISTASAQAWKSRKAR
jgi:hypothetical protein